MIFTEVGILKAKESQCGFQSKMAQMISPVVYRSLSVISDYASEKAVPAIRRGTPRQRGFATASCPCVRLHLDILRKISQSALSSIVA